jgi:hypothetical protein
MLSGGPDGRSDMSDQIGSGGNLLISGVLQLFCRSRDERIGCLFCGASQVRNGIGALGASVGLGISLRQVSRDAACHSARARVGCAAHLKISDVATTN